MTVHALFFQPLSRHQLPVFRFRCRADAHYARLVVWGAVGCLDEPQFGASKMGLVPGPGAATSMTADKRHNLRTDYHEKTTDRKMIRGAERRPRTHKRI
jgi:hypothetical protein